MLLQELFNLNEGHRLSYTKSYVAPKFSKTDVDVESELASGRKHPELDAARKHQALVDFAAKNPKMQLVPMSSGRIIYHIPAFKNQGITTYDHALASKIEKDLQKVISPKTQKFEANVFDSKEHRILKPGVTLAQLDSLAKDVFEKHGVKGVNHFITSIVTTAKELAKFSKSHITSHKSAFKKSHSRSSAPLQITIMRDGTAGESLPDSFYDKWPNEYEVDGSVFKLLTKETKDAISKFYDEDDVKPNTWPLTGIRLFATQNASSKQLADVLNARFSSSPKAWWDIYFS